MHRRTTSSATGSCAGSPGSNNFLQSCMSLSHLTANVCSHACCSHPSSQSPEAGGLVLQALNVGLPGLLLAPLLHDRVSCCSPQQLIPAVVAGFKRQILLCVNSNLFEVLSSATAWRQLMSDCCMHAQTENELSIKRHSSGTLEQEVHEPSCSSGPAGLSTMASTFLCCISVTRMCLRSRLTPWWNARWPPCSWCRCQVR